MYRNSLSLKDLVNLKDWQEAQDSFSEVLEIPLRAVDLKGRFSFRTTNPCPLRRKISPDNPNYFNFCGSCVLETEIGRKNNIKEVTNFKCRFGLDIFILPIRAIGNKTAAYMTVGPLILNRRKDKSEYQKYAEETAIDLEELIDALIEINVFSYNKVRSIIKLLSDIFSYMAQTGYHKKRLGEIAPKVIEMDPLFSRYYEEKVLDALLNACTMALDTDSGSIMTLDNDTRMLRIRAASKLDQRIMEDTSVKVGDGIAGVAASTAEPIILPKDEGKNGLSKKMKRKYIKSSMVVPFSKANTPDVYGVINLNMIRKGKDFSEKDIAFVKELLELASTALVCVK